MIGDDLTSLKEYLFSHNFPQRGKKSQHVIRGVCTCTCSTGSHGIDLAKRSVNKLPHKVEVCASTVLEMFPPTASTSNTALPYEREGELETCNTK